VTLLQAAYETPDWLAAIQDAWLVVIAATALLGGLLGLGAWLLRLWIRTEVDQANEESEVRLKKYIEEKTYHIQPDSNGGDSLADVAAMLRELLNKK